MEKRLETELTNLWNTYEAERDRTTAEITKMIEASKAAKQELLKQWEEKDAKTRESLRETESAIKTTMPEGGGIVDDDDKPLAMVTVEPHIKCKYIEVAEIQQDYIKKGFSKEQAADIAASTQAYLTKLVEFQAQQTPTPTPTGPLAAASSANRPGAPALPGGPSNAGRGDTDTSNAAKKMKSSADSAITTAVGKSDEEGSQHE